MAQKRIMLVGGGSGGHFYPLISVAEKLRDVPDVQLYYIGPFAYDIDAFRENNITFVYCPSGKRRKYRSILNVFDVFKVAYGFFRALIALYKIYPDVIFSKGSYTSVPVVLAGAFLRIPIVIHESDTKPGSANKLASRFARYIGVAFAETASYFDANKVALTGLPLRNAFTSDPLEPLSTLGITTLKPLIFVTGGSQGAQRLNDLILESLDELLPAFCVLHQVGTRNESSVKATAASLITDTAILADYYVLQSLDAAQMNAAMSAAALIISRAGTGTIFEIAQKGKPSILIPIPEEISHDQRSNAYAYAHAGACSVLEEHNLTDGLLVSEITRIMGDQGLYSDMATKAKAFVRTDAADVLAQTILSVALTH